MCCAKLRPDFREQHYVEADKKDDIEHIIRMRIKSKSATSGPPIGPVLGQYAIPISQFCTEFNERSGAYYNNDVDIFVTLYQYMDGTFSFDMFAPVTITCFRRAACQFVKKPRRASITPQMLFEAIVYRYSHADEYLYRRSGIGMRDVFMHYMDTFRSMRQRKILILRKAGYENAFKKY